MKRNFKLIVRVAIVTLAVIFTQNTYAESPTSDQADLLVHQSFITTPGNALMAGDGSQTELRDNSDQMELDLSNVASLGSSYTVRWKRDTDTSTDEVDVVEESANAFTEIPFTSENASYNDAVSSSKNIMLFDIKN